MTYLITFTCYGCHLHGAASGSVDRDHCIPGTPTLDANVTRARHVTGLMDQPPYVLDARRRDAVLYAIQNICRYREWHLLAAHVRTTHVHVVVEADAEPERVLNDFKSYSSRHLNEAKIDPPGRKRWTRHGSTRWLTGPHSVAAAMEYVTKDQGEPMAIFQADA